MAKNRKKHHIGPIDTVGELIGLSEALFTIQRYHHKKAVATGHLITKYEGVVEIAPDVYVATGRARAELRQFVGGMIEREKTGVNELARLAGLPDMRPDIKKKAASNGG